MLGCFEFGAWLNRIAHLTTEETETTTRHDPLANYGHRPAQTNEPEPVENWVEEGMAFLTRDYRTKRKRRLS
jgi:hypothetical protein